MYVNGVQEEVTVDQAAVGTEGTDASNNLTIGGLPGEVGGSTIDNLRIYSRALTTADIQQLYNLGAPVYQCSDLIDNDGDGLIDFPSDPGCTSAMDNDETDPVIDPFTVISNWATFDPGTNGVGINPVNYNGAIYDGRYIYFSPFLSGTKEVLRYDTTALFTLSIAWTTFDPNPPSGGGYAGIVFDGKFVYFVPYGNGVTSHGEVLRYDTTSPFRSTASWSTYDPGANGIGNDPDGYDGGVFDGRYVYLSPTNNGTAPHGEVLRYDTTLPFGITSSWAVFDAGANGLGVNPRGYAGAVSDGRYIYFVPDLK